MVAKVLDNPTLVLNRNWQPVNVATVSRALVLLWNESARVVDPADYRLYTWADWSALRPREDEQFIQAVRLRLRVPEVVVLSAYDRLPSAAVSFSRRNVFKRDHWACQYCGRQCRCPWGTKDASADVSTSRNPRDMRNRPRRQPGSEELTIDHVIPRSQGWHLDLGELRVGVHRLQQAQKGPHTAAGRHAAPQGAAPAGVEADLRA